MVLFFLPKCSKVLHDISLLFLENIKVTEWKCECIDSIFQKTEMEIIKSYISFAYTEALILMGEATTASIAISYDVNFKFQYLISIISKHKTFKNQYTSRLSQHLCKSDFVYLTLCLLIARTSIGSCT